VLYSEAVAFHADELSDCDGLRESEESSGATLVAFDVLEVEGFDFSDQPLERRRALLTELLDPVPHGIMLSETIDGERWPDRVPSCLRAGLEGIVPKRLGSKYRAGSSPDWIKTKNPDWQGR
jgi:bifunctional non-homologous end joining protein LigD